MRAELTSLSRRLAFVGIAALAAAPAVAAEGEGLPQLDPAGFMPQLIWLAISFIVLYLLMSRVALPRIAGVLDERDRQIQSDLERAEKLKAEAEDALTAYQAAMTDARARAQAEIRKAAEAMAAEAAAREGELGAKLATRSEAAERSIVAAKQAAMADLTKLAADLAGTMAAKLAGVQPGAAAEAAVADVMRERR